MRLSTFTLTKIPNKTLAEIAHKNLREPGPPVYNEGEQNRVRCIKASADQDPACLDREIAPFGFSESIISDTSEFFWNALYAAFGLALAPKGSRHNWMVTTRAGSPIGINPETMQKHFPNKTAEHRSNHTAATAAERRQS